MDTEKGEPPPFLRGYRQRAGELQFMGDAKHMGIYGDALDDAECLIEHHICSLAPYAGKLLHLVYVAGNFRPPKSDMIICAQAMQFFALVR